MNVPEQFIVYQVKDVPEVTGHHGWVECDKKIFDRETKREKRRLAVLPKYTAFVRKWFSPASGWYGTIEVRDQNTVLFKTDLFHTDGDAGWVRTLVSHLIGRSLLGFQSRWGGTQWLREEMNIDYDVLEVKRKGDL